ncbi:MAG: divergent polysaccharide deacetylase family protein [Gammaproteobacteria bacterium]|nr:divergent polysaccharide deacetylase family protein [Gammaproteobacteria bacterium]
MPFTLRACVTALLAVFACASAAEEEQAHTPKIAIIIDDVGDRFADGKRAINLPGKIAYAFLPHTPYAKKLAQLAHELDKEVLLHLPLESMTGKRLGPGAIEMDVSKEAFNEKLRENLNAIPHVRGVNNHMGSLLTRHPGHMAWLMDELIAWGGLFFIDSYTTDASIAYRIAQEKGVPTARRDVFLDGDKNPEIIRAEFTRLIKEAQTRGYAVAIGHPYPETLAVLEDVLKDLSEHGVDLVPVAEIVALDEASRTAGRGSAVAAGHP